MLIRANNICFWCPLDLVTKKVKVSGLCFTFSKAVNLAELVVDKKGVATN